MSLDDIAVNKIIAELNKTKEELKNLITASETRLQLSIENLNHKINALEEENLTLKNKLELLERRSKTNNLVIFGLKKESTEVSVDFVIKQLNNLLGISVEVRDINNIYCLGRHYNCPVKLEFVSHLKKKEIFRNAKKFKNTGVSVSNDLTSSQQGDLKILKRFLIKEREQDKNRRCFIRGNKLYIDESSYTAEELISIDNGLINSVKANSVPNTPTTNEVPNTSVFESPLQIDKQEDKPPSGQNVKKNTVPKTLYPKASQKKLISQIGGVSTRSTSSSSNDKLKR